MIYISSELVLADLAGDGRVNGPMIGYRQLLTLASLSSDEAAAGFPVTNLANNSTAEKWKAETDTEQYITAFLSSPQAFDYVGLAAHTLGSTGTVVQVQISDDGDAWEDIGPDFLPGDDSPIMVRFPSTTRQWVRLKLTPDTDPPAIGILYIGQLLILQRNIYVGFTPMTYDYTNVISTGISESGQFLGAIARRANPGCTIPQKNLTAAWFRTNMAPFLRAATGTGADRYRQPFFFAWRPTDYPSEVAFGWIPEGATPTVSNARPNGMMDATVPMQGIL